MVIVSCVAIPLSLKPTLVLKHVLNMKNKCESLIYLFARKINTVEIFIRAKDSSRSTSVGGNINARFTLIIPYREIAVLKVVKSWVELSSTI